MRKIHRKFYGLIAFIGFVIVIGSFGDSDLEKINYTTLVIRTNIGAILTGIGLIGLKKEGCFDE